MSKYKYRPEFVNATKCTVENLKELQDKTRLNIRPGNYLVEKANGFVEVWTKNAFDRKFEKVEE